MLKLTEKEKLVLYSVVNWPTLNDIELSKKIPVKRPTITAIRNKLKKDGLYSEVVVPNFEMLDCEILTVRYGSFNPAVKYEDRKKHSSLEKFPEVFFKESCDSHRIAMSASTSFTEIMKYVEYSNMTYEKNDLMSEEGIHHVHFPLKLCKIFRFFDYSQLLKNDFKIDIKDEKPIGGTFFKKTYRREFSENEKLVFYALVKYPDLNDKEVAKKVSMTRQSVNKMRKKFEKEDLIKRIRIPKVKKLGYEVMEFVHFFLNPKYMIDDRKDAIKQITSLYPGIITLICGNLETVVLGVNKNYSEMKKSYDQFLRMYKKSDYMAKEPVMVLIPIAEIQEEAIGRYHPLVKKILQIKQDI